MDLAMVGMLGLGAATAGYAAYRSVRRRQAVLDRLLAERAAALADAEAATALLASERREAAARLNSELDAARIRNYDALLYSKGPLANALVTLSDVAVETASRRPGPMPTGDRPAEVLSWLKVAAETVEALTVLLHVLVYELKWALELAGEQVPELTAHLLVRGPTEASADWVRTVVRTTPFRQKRDYRVAAVPWPHARRLLTTMDPAFSADEQDAVEYQRRVDDRILDRHWANHPHAKEACGSKLVVRISRPARKEGAMVGLWDGPAHGPAAGLVCIESPAVGAWNDASRRVMETVMGPTLKQVRFGLAIYGRAWREVEVNDGGSFPHRKGPPSDSSLSSVTFSDSSGMPAVAGRWEPPLDWQDDRVQRALKTLQDAYPNRDDLAVLAENTGIAQAYLDWTNRTHAHRHAMQVAAEHGLLRKLLEVARDDPAKGGFRRLFEQLLTE